MSSIKVSRKDLYASESEPETEEQTSYSYVPDLVFEEVADIETSSQEEDTEGKQQNENIADTDAADEEFEFNLFAEEPAKVVIVPDEPVALLPSGPEQVQEGVIYVEMHRPDSYYFASYSDAQKTQFEAAAVSGADILAVQGQPLQPRFLGAARGPKVIDFNEAVAQAKRDHQRMRNRRRPGKKARLIRKERYATQQEQRKQMQRQRSKQPRSFTNNSNNKSKAGATGGYKRPASTGGHPRKVKKVQT